VTFKARVLRGLASVALAPPAVGLLGRNHREGGELDPQIAAVLELQRLLRAPALESLEPARARRFAEAGMSVLDPAPVSMARVIDTRVDAIPVRIYVPDDTTDDWIVYFHGGGGVIGSIRSSDAVARGLAAGTGCTVASVDYRLGPEHRHPAAIDDAVAAWNGLIARVPGRAAVAGESFGGFLAAHVSRAAPRTPDLQVLIYPWLDLAMQSPSIARLADGYLLTRTLLVWFRDHYLHAATTEDDRRAASPSSWTDLATAPPAIVVTAGFDPLVDEGDDYAAALARAGVPVIHRRYPALIHGFLGLSGGVRAARAAFDDLCRDLRDGW